MPILAANQERKRERRGLVVALAALLIVIPVALLAVMAVQPVELHAGRFHFRSSYEDDRHSRRDWVVPQGISYYPPAGPNGSRVWDLHLAHSMWTFRIETW